MKPVSFFNIAKVGAARKPQLTPATRGRLQDGGISFFSIVNDAAEFAGRTEVRPALKLEVCDPTQPTLDDLFRKTVEGFHKNSGSTANQTENLPVESKAKLSNDVKKEPIVRQAIKFHKLEGRL